LVLRRPIAGSNFHYPYKAEAARYELSIFCASALRPECIWKALRHHPADLFLQFAKWEAKAVRKIHDRMFVVQNGKSLGMRHLASGPR
jgi:hypothetical protein